MLDLRDDPFFTPLLYEGEGEYDYNTLIYMRTWIFTTLK